MFRSREAISGSSVSKSGGVYTTETPSMKGTCVNKTALYS